MKRWFLLLVLLLVAGCHRGWTVRGKLVDAKRKPIAGTTVRFKCGPSGAAGGPIGNFMSNDDGIFTAAGNLDTDPASCSLEVIASGHQTTAFGVSEACYRSSAHKNLGDPCLDSEMVVP